MQLRNRSYNMSQSVNGYPEYLMGLDVPGFSDIPFWKKFTEIRRPTPGQLFVFIDEHPDTLYDAQFGNPAGAPYWGPLWFDMPADRHNRGACLSFADGHAERWRWRVPMTFQYLGDFPSGDQMPDYLRVQNAMKCWSDDQSDRLLAAHADRLRECPLANPPRLSHNSSVRLITSAA